MDRYAQYAVPCGQTVGPLVSFMAFKQAGATDILIAFLTEKLGDLYRGLDSMARDILPRVRE